MPAGLSDTELQGPSLGRERNQEVLATQPQEHLGMRQRQTPRAWA